MTRPPSKAFSLIELMIVVGIIGIMASVALPVFRTYALRSKSSEASILLDKIAQAEIAFYQRPRYDANGALQWPCFLHAAFNPVGFPTSAKRTWTGNSNFNALGFSPSGNVYYSYASGRLTGRPNDATFGVTPVSSCASPQISFVDYFLVSSDPNFVRASVVAYGDLDGDGFFSLFYRDLTLGVSKSGAAGPLKIEYEIE